MACSRDAQPVTTTFTLNTGNSMPSVGLGCFKNANKEQMFETLDTALSAGYRLFDTAPVYKNEVYFREAFNVLLPKYKLERADIFITVKISPSVTTTASAMKKSCELSLKALGMDYIDLYLIQFPVITKFPKDHAKNVALQNRMWSSLVNLYDGGLVNAIGVLNLSLKQLKQMLKYNHNVIPAVIQIEWKPLHFNNNLQNFCKEHDIVLQIYSPLNEEQSESLINHHCLNNFAKNSDVSKSQILFAWALQKDVAVLLKSSCADYIRKNILLNFTLPNHILRILNDLEKQNCKHPWNYATNHSSTCICKR